MVLFDEKIQGKMKILLFLYYILLQDYYDLLFNAAIIFSTTPLIFVYFDLYYLFYVCVSHPFGNERLE